MMDNTDEWSMAKVDIIDAYHMMACKKSEWQYLRAREGVYIDQCLPMGASSSCAMFQRISGAIAWITMNASPILYMVFYYLDDFLLLAKSKI